MGKKKQHNSKETERYTSFRDLQSNDTGSILGINFSRNSEQRELIRMMQENDLPCIFCFGKAGTGKTFTALAAAIDLVKVKKKYNKIYYIREPLEVGKSLRLCSWRYFTEVRSLFKWLRR